MGVCWRSQRSLNIQEIVVQRALVSQLYYPPYFSLLLTENQSGGTPMYQPESTQPSAVTWFKVYCAVLALLYLGMGIMTLILFTNSRKMDFSRPEMQIAAVAIVGTSLVCFSAYVLPFFVEPRPWVWIYGIVLIAVGMSSTCFLPACIPLLIFWFKPDVKSYFGKSSI